MDDKTKIQIKNLTDHRVGLQCNNFPASYKFNAGQILKVPWEHLQDASYDFGVSYLFRNGMLRVEKTNPDYDEIMEEMQLSEFKERIESSLSLEDAKKLLSVSPIQNCYFKVKTELTNGTAGTKENIVNAALELGIRDYKLNQMIKEAMGVNVIRTLELEDEMKKG